MQKAAQRDMPVHVQVVLFKASTFTHMRKSFMKTVCVADVHCVYIPYYKSVPLYFRNAFSLMTNL